MKTSRAPSPAAGWRHALALAALAIGPGTVAAERTPDAFPGAESFVYREAEPAPVLLHVFKPAGWQASDRRPAYIRFFGGGWVHGTPAQSVGWARDAAELGMVGIAPDYRVKQRWPEADATWTVADARRAMRWVQDHAAELGIDPRRIVVAGSSAGAHLALWTAISAAPPGLAADESPLYPPAALILSSAPSDTTAATGVGNDRFRSATPDAFSPLQHLDPVMPPVLLIHGDADPLVPFSQSERLHAALIATGNQSEFHRVAGGKHNYTADAPEWKKRGPAVQRDFLESLNILPVTLP